MFDQKTPLLFRTPCMSTFDIHARRRVIWHHIFKSSKHVPSDVQRLGTWPACDFTDLTVTCVVAHCQGTIVCNWPFSERRTSHHVLFLAETHASLLCVLVNSKSFMKGPPCFVLNVPQWFSCVPLRPHHVLQIWNTLTFKQSEDPHSSSYMRPDLVIPDRIIGSSDGKNRWNNGSVNYGFAYTRQSDDVWHHIFKSSEHVPSDVHSHGTQPASDLTVGCIVALCQGSGICNWQSSWSRMSHHALFVTETHDSTSRHVVCIGQSQELHDRYRFKTPFWKLLEHVVFARIISSFALT